MSQNYTIYLLNVLQIKSHETLPTSLNVSCTEQRCFRLILDHTNQRIQLSLYK
jgi:hypothetical protein